jgi:hypothetical protein
MLPQSTKKLANSYKDRVPLKTIELAESRKISNQPAMLALDEKEKKIKASLSEIQKKIDNFQNSPYQAIPEMADFTVEGLARKLIDGGGTIDDLKTPQIETEKENLYQQKRILHRALELVAADRQQLKSKLITAGCDALSPEARGIYADVVKTGEAYENALKRMEGFHALLLSCGIETDYRPAGWRILPKEFDVLYGNNSPSFSWYLEQRRQLCGLPLTGKNHKSI